MPLAPKSMQEVEQPSFVSDPSAIREQLDRLLIHPLFANSKRYPALLAYTVEQTLLGNAADLKERSIGVEVFGRAPTYDANADPIVRITAGEVRKRLGLYYYDSSHNGELVIELPTGSYVPVFRQGEVLTDLPDLVPEPEMDQPAPGFEDVASALPESKPPRIRWLLVSGVVALACAAGISIGLRIHPAPTVEPPSNIDRFWEPFLSSANPTTFCLG